MSAQPCDYSRTPTPLPPAPRRVRGRFGVYRLTVFLFYLAAQLWALGYLLLVILTALSGTDILAHIVNTRIHHRSGDSYYVDFFYTISGVNYDGTAGVSRETYDRFTEALRHPGPDAKSRTAAIRYYAFGPFHYADFTPESQLPSNLLFALFVSALLFLLRYLFYIHYRLLFKYGHATEGVIHRKYIRRSKGTTSYCLAFSFTNPTTGKTVETKCDCANEHLYHAAHINQHVTVLYSPLCPRYSTLYEFCLYTVRLPDGTSP